jgi:hypothetical protein
LQEKSLILYTQADVGKQFTLIVSEVGATDPLWRTDTIEYTIMVDVVEQGNNIVPVYTIYSAYGMILFHNYLDARGFFTPEATKTPYGATMVDSQFTFAVRDMATGAIVSTGTNDSNGDIFFSAIPYTQDDNGKSFKYTVVEKSIGGISWQTDSTVFEVTVNVAEGIIAGNTVLLATPVYPTGGIVFTNTFIPPPSGSLTIAKEFKDLPSGIDVFNQNVVSPISFLVIGTNSANAEIYRQTVVFNRTNFTFNSITGTFNCVLPSLPPGTYTVTESGGHTSGYQLGVSTPSPSINLTTTGATFRIVNTYTQTPVAPAQHPALTVNKVFHGLAQAERPADFQIIITGPGGFSQTLNLNQAVSGNGGTFTNLATGTYTINEANSNVSGFNTTVSINNRPVTLPFTVQVTTGHTMVTIDNFYSPAPPAPKTGVNHNIFLPVLLFSLGALSITGAVIYRKRAK